MRLPNPRFLPILALVLACGPAKAAENAPAGEPEPIAPAFRAERHFADGAAYITALPEGTRVLVQRMDGASFTLVLSNGKLSTTLPPAKLSESGDVWTSPLGYRLTPYLESQPPGLAIFAPGGAWTTFSLVGARALFAVERNGKYWSWDLDFAFVLRLPDGTRVDLLERGKRWEALTLNGERVRLDADEGVWRTLPRLTAPPLVPEVDSLFPSRAGDSWRKNGEEDHYVFAWNWHPIGFTPAKAIEDVQSGWRRDDLDGYFRTLGRVQPPADMAACLLGRRLALGGGDQLTFEIPGQSPYTAIILPGPLDPDFFELRDEAKVRRRFTPRKAPTEPQ